MTKPKKRSKKSQKQQIERIIKNLPDTLSEKEKILFAKNSLGGSPRNILTKQKNIKQPTKSVNPSFKFYKSKDGEGTISRKRSYRPVIGGKTGGKK